VDISGITPTPGKKIIASCQTAIDEQITERKKVGS